MNPAHLHLVVNHLPLFASLFGGGLLAWGIVRRQEAVSRAGLVLAVLAAAGGVLAVQSGERAEEIVEDLAGVSEPAIEPHEEAGEQAQTAAIILGILAFGALVVPAKKERPRRALMWAALIAAAASFALTARAANLGGKIRHPEISGDIGIPYGDIEHEQDNDEPGE